MVIIGVVVLLLATVLDLGATWLLGGILLAWAGLVKVIVVALWRGVANLHAPESEYSGDQGSGKVL